MGNYEDMDKFLFHHRCLDLIFTIQGESENSFHDSLSKIDISDLLYPNNNIYG